MVEAGNDRRVAILGGGIAGLASAHYLQNEGYTPVVYEASDHLGGLGAHFEHEGVTLDRFYHVILDSDAELCGLLEELGIEPVMTGATVESLRRVPELGIPDLPVVADDVTGLDVRR